MSVLYILLAILVLGILIVVHELGHYTVGKLLKFRINEFGIGFGPKLLSWGKKETKYCIKALPLGGYVSFAGEDEENQDDPRAMNNMPWYKRLAVLVAGAGFNIIFALIVCFVVVCATGKALPAPVIKEISNGAPAQQTELQAGDIATHINGVSIYDFDDLDAQLDKLKKQNETFVIMTVQRGDESKDVKLDFYKPDVNSDDLKIGITFTQNTVPISIGEGVGRTFEVSWDLTKEMFKFLGRLVTGQEGIEGVSGPVSTIGIMKDEISLSATNAGVTGVIITVLQLVWIIGLNLAIFNLLPIPALDGGRVVFVIIEAIRRKPINRELEAKIHAAGFLILIGLVIALEIARAIML